MYTGLLQAILIFSTRHMLFEGTYQEDVLWGIREYIKKKDLCFSISADITD